MAVDRVERPSVPDAAHDELVERLDAQLRERVRREGVDPQREALVVRRIAEDVVRDHDDLSLTGAVAPIADDGAMVGELVARVSGFGPLQPFLDDPEVEEIWINDPSRVFIARRGRHELTNLRLDAAQVNELVERMLKSSGRRLDISTPFVDAMLPEGHRLHVVLEGITRGFTAVNIRKFLLRAHRLSDLVALGSLTPQAARFLEASVRAGLNVLVAGGTQAGKTTMLNCLAAAVPGGERVVSAEEVFELRFSHPDWVAMQTRQAGLEQTGAIVLRDLVKEALRMRPSRILVGEVRAAECLDLLLALNSGLPGMCTHATIHVYGETTTGQGRGRGGHLLPHLARPGSRGAGGCSAGAGLPRPRRQAGARGRRSVHGQRHERGQRQAPQAVRPNVRGHRAG
jgi:pilus assembly protein CpaF